MGIFFFKLLWPSQNIWTLTKLFCPNFTRNLLKLKHIFKTCFLKMFLKIVDEQKFNRDVLQFLTLLNRVKKCKGLLCARFQFVRRFCNITSSHHDFRPEVWAYWAPLPRADGVCILYTSDCSHISSYLHRQLLPTALLV